jgi:hypothetical protein
VSWQNQHNGLATSMDPDQPALPRSRIRIHDVCLPTLLQVEKLIANNMDPDQTVRMRRLVWIHAVRKRTMLVLSWRGSFIQLTDSERLVGNVRKQCFAYHSKLQWYLIMRHSLLFYNSPLNWRKISYYYM